MSSKSDGSCDKNFPSVKHNMSSVFKDGSSNNTPCISPALATLRREEEHQVSPHMASENQSQVKTFSCTSTLPIRNYTNNYNMQQASQQLNPSLEQQPLPMSSKIPTPGR